MLYFHDIVLLALLAGLCHAADLYVALGGSDSNAGTLAAPFLTIQKGVDTATAGTTIYLRAGTYAPSKNIQIKKNGTSSQLYIMRPYNSEKVILDGENMPGYVTF